MPYILLQSTICPFTGNLVPALPEPHSSQLLILKMCDQSEALPFGAEGDAVEYSHKYFLLQISVAESHGFSLDAHEVVRRSSTKLRPLSLKLGNHRHKSKY